MGTLGAIQIHGTSSYGLLLRLVLPRRLLLLLTRKLLLLLLVLVTRLVLQIARLPSCQVMHYGDGCSDEGLQLPGYVSPLPHLTSSFKIFVIRSHLLNIFQTLVRSSISDWPISII